MVARLVVINGQFSGREFVLNDGVNLIGRKDLENRIIPEVDLEEVDIDAKVSRRHATIEISSAGTEVTIQDLGSLNGTYFQGGQMLTPDLKAQLHNGDEILIGNIILRLVLA